MMFETNGERIGKQATPAVKELLIDVVKETARKTELPFGVNFSSVGQEASFQAAKETGASFMRLDASEEVADRRKEFGLERIVLMTDIPTERISPIPSDKSLEASVKQLVDGGSDVLVINGISPDAQPPINKIVKAKHIAEDVPVFVGSGFGAGNASELLKCADGAIVDGTFNHQGNPKNPVSEERVRNVMETVRRLR
jgi:predicted TIM-barrel enzyme